MKTTKLFLLPLISSVSLFPLFSLTSCNSKQIVVITNDTSTETISLYSYGTDVSYVLAFSQVINIGTLQKNNNDAQKFKIEGDIVNKPIFIPLGTNCELYGSHDSRILSAGTTGWNYGVIIGTDKSNDTEEKTTNVYLHNLSINISNNGGDGVNGIFIDHATMVDIYHNQISTTQSDANIGINATSVEELNIVSNIITNNGVGEENILLDDVEELMVAHNIIENYCNSPTAIEFGNIDEGVIRENFIGSSFNGPNATIFNAVNECNVDFTSNIINAYSTFDDGFSAGFGAPQIKENVSYEIISVDNVPNPGDCVISGYGNVCIGNGVQDVDDKISTHGTYAATTEVIQHLSYNYEDAYFYNFFFFWGYEGDFIFHLYALDLDIHNAYTSSIIANVLGLDKEESE